MSAELPRAILFDWDNTLVDNWPTIHDALNTTLAAMGHPTWSLAETRARVRASLRDSFPVMFGARWEAARDIFYARFEARHIETLAPLPGAAALLNALHARGVYLGVVSNKTGRYLRKEAAALGWTGRFGRLVGAQDAAVDKPHRAPVDLALADAGMVAGPAVWFVGDTAMDMRCAYAAGCTAVLVGDT
ncbi:MAG: HAD family hydrolase, partial [Proteobacteria bacterium]|nr:HAD family hydrolase [Pseudomonadota bacterium]